MQSQESLKRHLKRCRPGCLKHHHNRGQFKLLTFEEFKERREAVKAALTGSEADQSSLTLESTVNAISGTSTHAVEAT